MIQGQGQAAEGGDGHRVALRRVVHVVVAPEADVEIERPALAGADALEVVLHDALHRRRQPFLAANLPEDFFGLVVAPEREEHGGVVELRAVEVGALLGEGAEESRGLGEMAAGDQGQRGGVAEGARVGAFGRLPHGLAEEGVGRLRVPCHDQTPGGFNRRGPDGRREGPRAAVEEGGDEYDGTRQTRDVHGRRALPRVSPRHGGRSVSGATPYCFLAPNAPTASSRRKAPKTSSSFGPLKSTLKPSSTEV